MPPNSVLAGAFAVLLEASMQGFENSTRIQRAYAPTAIVVEQAGGLQFKKKQRERQGPDYYRGRVDALLRSHLAGTGEILAAYTSQLLQPGVAEVGVRRTTNQHEELADFFEVYHFDDAPAVLKPSVSKVLFPSASSAGEVKQRVSEASVADVEAKVAEFALSLEAAAVGDAEVKAFVDTLVERKVAERVATVVNQVRHEFETKLQGFDTRLSAAERAVAKPTSALGRAVLELALGTPKRVLEQQYDVFILRLARWIVAALFF